MTVHEELLDGCRKGELPFLYVPSDIGTIDDYYSTNQKSQEQFEKKFKWRVLIDVVVMGGVFALCVWWLSEVPVVFCVVFSIVLGIVLYRLLKASSFDGSDSFLGTEGFSVVNFCKARDNVNIRSFSFDDVECILNFEDVKVGRHQSYRYTVYGFTFYGHKQGDMLPTLYMVEDICHADRSASDEKNQKYIFWREVTLKWSEKQFVSIEEKLQRGEKVSFRMVYSSKFIDDYIVFNGPQLTIGGVVYEKDTIKSIKIERKILFIEHINYKSGFLGIGAKGDESRLWIREIVNNKLFLMTLRYFVMKYYPDFSSVVNARNYLL